MSDRDDSSALIESPFNAVPPVILILALAAGLVEIALMLGEAGLIGGPAAVGWRLALIQDWGVSPLVFDQVAVHGEWSWPMVRRFVAYAGIHGSFTQALFGVALLLALGKFVGEVFHWAALVLLLVLCTLAGAIVFGLVFSGPVALIGLYPMDYGLIGAFTYLLWQRAGRMGENRLRAFRLIGVLMGLQLVFSLLFGSNPAWLADVAGFVAGFSASLLVAPGGWNAFVARMRERS